MAQKKQTQPQGNPLQQAVGTLTGLSAAELPSGISLNWLEEYQAATVGKKTINVQKEVPADGAFVVVWPGEQGLKAKYVAKNKKERKYDSRAQFLTVAPAEKPAEASTEGEAGNGKQ